MIPQPLSSLLALTNDPIPPTTSKDSLETIKFLHSCHMSIRDSITNIINKNPENIAISDTAGTICSTHDKMAWKLRSYISV